MNLDTAITELETLDAEAAQLDEIRNGPKYAQYTRSARDELYKAKRAEKQAVWNAAIDKTFGASIDSDRPELGHRTLDPNAPVWAELSKAESKLSAARQAAEVSGVDPALALYSVERAKALIASATAHNMSMTNAPSVTANNLRQQYQSAPREVKYALQDLGASLLGDRKDTSTRSFIRELEADRAARLRTPDVIAAEQTLTEVSQKAEKLYKAMQRTYNRLFGSGSLESHYADQRMRLISLEYDNGRPALTRRYAGVRLKTQDQEPEIFGGNR